MLLKLKQRIQEKAKMNQEQLKTQDQLKKIQEQIVHSDPTNKQKKLDTAPTTPIKDHQQESRINQQLMNMNHTTRQGLSNDTLNQHENQATSLNLNVDQQTKESTQIQANNVHEVTNNNNNNNIIVDLNNQVQKDKSEEGEIHLEANVNEDVNGIQIHQENKVNQHNQQNHTINKTENNQEKTNEEKGQQKQINHQVNNGQIIVEQIKNNINENSSSQLQQVLLVNHNSSNNNDIQNSQIMTIDTINGQKNIQENIFNQQHQQQNSHNNSQNLLIQLENIQKDKETDNNQFNQDNHDAQENKQKEVEEIQIYQVSPEELQQEKFDIIMNQMKIITKLVSRPVKSQDGKNQKTYSKQIAIQIEPLYPIESLLGYSQKNENNQSLIDSVQIVQHQHLDFKHQDASKQLLEGKCLLVAKFTNQTLPKQLEILFGTVQQLYQTMKSYQKTIFCLDLIKESRQLVLKIPIFEKKKQFKVILYKNQLPVEIFLQRKNNQLVEQMKGLYQKYTLTKEKYDQIKTQLQKHQKFQKSRHDMIRNSQSNNKNNTTGTKPVQRPDEKTIQIMKSILKRDNNSRDLKNSTLSDQKDSNQESPVIEKSIRKKAKKNEPTTPSSRR